MGRRKKNDEDNFLGGLIIFIICAVLTGLVGFGVYYGLQKLTPNKGLTEIPDNPPVQEPSEDPDSSQKSPVQNPKTQEFVNIFFIGKNGNNEEVYRAVKRSYDKEVDGTKISYAIDCLVKGPKSSEKTKGVYTEIPAQTVLIGVNEKPDKVIINLSSAYAAGGGTESVYKRLFQLIKTAKRNTDKPVYLFIDGKQADVIGGDGIMITQPLSETSLD